MSKPVLFTTNRLCRCRYCETTIERNEEHFKWLIKDTNNTQVHFHVECAYEIMSDFELVFS